MRSNDIAVQQKLMAIIEKFGSAVVCPFEFPLEFGDYLFRYGCMWAQGWRHLSMFDHEGRWRAVLTDKPQGRSNFYEYSDVMDSILTLTADQGPHRFEVWPVEHLGYVVIAQPIEAGESKSQSPTTEAQSSEIPA